MVVTLLSQGRTVPDVVNCFYGGTAGVDAETLSLKNLLIRFRMQVGEASAEFNLPAVHGDGPEGPLTVLFGPGWQVALIDA